MRRFALALASIALIGAPAHPQAAKRPPQVDYTAFNGQKLQLFAWPGKHLVLFTQRGDLDRKTMDRVVAAYDRVYASYLEATSFPPIGGNTWEGRLVIAQVPETCGAGCGLIGANGVELAPDIFDGLYRSALRREGYDHVILYELGRNFWRYGRQIETNELIRKGPDDRGSGDAFVNGFPILMELAIAEHLRMKVVDMDRLRAAHEWWLDRYLADPRQTVHNTVLDFQASVVDPPVGNRIGSMDFFAAIMMRLARENGGWPFLSRFWKEVEARPCFATAQDGLDNVALAASLAAGKDLTPTFAGRLKWPVSEAARAEVREALRQAKTPGARETAKAAADRIAALQGKGVKLVSVTTSRGPVLLEVDANRTAIDAADLASLAGIPTLRSLNLYGTPLDGPALRSLGRLENLQWLNIGGSSIDDASLDALSGMPRLQELELNDVKAVTDAGIMKLPVSDRLTHLRLGGTGVGDAAMRELAARFPALRELNVAVTSVGPEGFRALARSKTLASITAYQSGLDDDSLVALAGALPGLRYVNASATAVTAQGAERARRARPGLEVTR
jgi:hypothetical protein